MTSSSGRLRTDTALSGRCVLVNGAGRGIGRGIALAAASRGASVMVTALRADEAGAVAAEIADRGDVAASASCDVTDESAVRRVVALTQERFGSLDAVVHNAVPPSAAEIDPIENPDDRIWHEQVAVGLRGLYHFARHTHDALRKSGGAFLVMVSKAGFTGVAEQASYAAVKGSQRGFIRALAREWGASGIRVNGLSPSAMTPALATYLAENPHMERDLIERAALRRLGDAEYDIGAAACFLIGSDSRFVTGQTLIVDGGGLMP